MLKRILAILMCSVVSIGLMTGCVLKSKPGTDNLHKSEKMPLSTSFQLFGKNHSLPCKFSDLGDVSFDYKTAVPCKDGSSVYGAFSSGDYRIGRVILADCSPDGKKFQNKEVHFIELSPDFGFDDLEFEYCGFNYKTSKSTIVDSFGTPDQEFDNNICYKLGNDGYVEFEFANEFSEIESISIKLD